MEVFILIITVVGTTLGSEHHVGRIIKISALMMVHVRKNALEKGEKERWLERTVKEQMQTG